MTIQIIKWISVGFPVSLVVFFFNSKLANLVNFDDPEVGSEA